MTGGCRADTRHGLFEGLAGCMLCSCVFAQCFGGCKSSDLGHCFLSLRAPIRRVQKVQWTQASTSSFNFLWLGRAALLSGTVLLELQLFILCCCSLQADQSPMCIRVPSSLPANWALQGRRICTSGAPSLYCQTLWQNGSWNSLLINVQRCTWEEKHTLWWSLN